MFAWKAMTPILNEYIRTIPHLSTKHIGDFLISAQSSWSAIDPKCSVIRGSSSAVVIGEWYLYRHVQNCMYLYIYIYVHVCIHIMLYIYIWIPMSNDRMCIYTYICIYVVLRNTFYTYIRDMKILEEPFGTFFCHRRLGIREGTLTRKFA